MNDQLNYLNDYNLNNNVNHDNNFNINNINRNQQRPIRRILTSIHNAKHAMRLHFNQLINHYMFYDIARENNLTLEQTHYYRFHYLCAVGNIEELQKWIEDYIRNNSYQEFYALANRPLYIHYNNYYLSPIFTASMWNDSPELIRFLYSYGLELHTTDQYGNFVEDAINYLPYFNPIAHLFQDRNIFGQNRVNYPEHRLIRDSTEFQNVIREIRIISGEMRPFDGWQPVQRRYQLE